MADSQSEWPPAAQRFPRFPRNHSIRLAEKDGDSETSSLPDRSGIVCVAGGLVVLPVSHSVLAIIRFNAGDIVLASSLTGAARVELSMGPGILPQCSR